ncbi:MAG: hypothetical protein JO057_03650 [Chloroflexi bacterium]|nr:hypothetical protein [Chloroflexota bacterium]
MRGQAVIDPPDGQFALELGKCWQDVKHQLAVLRWNAVPTTVSMSCMSALAQADDGVASRRRVDVDRLGRHTERQGRSGLASELQQNVTPHEEGGRL